MKSERYKGISSQDLNPVHSGDRRACYHSATKPQVTRKTLHIFLIKKHLPSKFNSQVMSLRGEEKKAKWTRKKYEVTRIKRKKRQSKII